MPSSASLGAVVLNNLWFVGEMRDSIVESDVIVQELAYRRERWNLLLRRGGPKKISPFVLHDLGIYGGAQGIWIDKARTGKLTENYSDPESQAHPHFP